MVLTKALEVYGKYLRLIAAIILPIGIANGLILCTISNSEYIFQLDYLLRFNITGWLLSALWIGALIYALSLLESEQEITYSNALLHGVGNWWKIALVALVIIGFKYLLMLSSAYSSLLAGLFFLIAIFVSMRYILIFPVLILENRGTMESLRRSAELSQGQRLNMFFEFIGLWLLLKVVIFLMQMLIGMAGNLLGGIWFTHLTFVIVIGIIEPLVTSLIIVWIYCYYLQQYRIFPGYVPSDQALHAQDQEGR